MTAAALGHAGGLKTEEAHVPGHTQLEAFYKDADGVERWHRLDPFWGVVVYDKTGLAHRHLGGDQGRPQRRPAAEQDRRSPGATRSPTASGSPRRLPASRTAACAPAATRWTSRSTPARPTSCRGSGSAGLAFCNANPGSRDKMNTWGWLRFQYAEGDLDKLAYGHELLRPFIEKVDDQLQVHEAHGTLFFKPLLNGAVRRQPLQACRQREGRRQRAVAVPGQGGAPAELVYLVQTPYVIANAAVAGNFRTGPGDKVKVSVARADWREQDYTLDQVLPAKPQWQAIWESSGEGRQQMRLRDTDLGLRGEYKFLVKVEMTAAREPILVGMDQLGFVVRFQEGVMALPRLLPGKNVIHVTAGRIQPDYNLQVTYIWDDTVGKEREAVKTIDKVPYEFEIQAAGTQPADVSSRAVILQAVAQGRAAGEAVVPGSRAPLRPERSSQKEPGQ